MLKKFFLLLFENKKFDWENKQKTWNYSINKQINKNVEH
jgi:hypothetical protein